MMSEAKAADLEVLGWIGWTVSWRVLGRAGLSCGILAHERYAVAGVGGGGGRALGGPLRVLQRLGGVRRHPPRTVLLHRDDPRRGLDGGCRDQLGRCHCD